MSVGPMRVGPMRVGDGRGLGGPVTFRFDGRDVAARAGDTVASALLANGVRLVGRSFKYHRPRGILSTGAEEPNAIVTADGVPNTRATVQEAYDGLNVRSQNAWPHRAFDLMAVNDALSPVFSAGFYYKTFMWPRAFWEGLYEPLIRRAAGLGALSGRSDDQPFEKAWAFADLLVIGGGPAGLMAARTAGRAGLRVILCDEGSALGGRLLMEAEEIEGAPAHVWVHAVAAELAAMPNVRVLTRTTVTGAYDHGSYGALERVSLHRPAGEAPRECFWRIVAPRAVLAAGAIERPVVFPGNDRPGVMLAGAVRGYLHRWGVAVGRRVAVLGSGADAARTVRDLRAAGVEVVAHIDSRAGTRVPESVPVHAGARIAGTRGRLGLRSITLDSGTTVEADALAMAGGWTPSVHLACHLGKKPVWDEAAQAFLAPPDAVPGMVVAGAAAGLRSTAACLADGHRAAAIAVEEAGRAVPEADLPLGDDRAGEAVPFVAMPGVRAFVDYQNDVTVKDIALSAQEGFRSVEHMKRYTTQGMATDQGKTGNVAAIHLLAESLGSPVAAVGTTTYRPPYTPVSIAAMGAGGQGDGFAPVRLTTSDAALRERGAPMIEAGLWYRPSYVPRPGETTWRESCDREVRTVREAVGVADVSTLGKIDVQGPDAAAFLDLVYTNTMSTLSVGRVRYGLMLREDGFVMDDGTCARLGETHYVVTTTTAAAGLVMRHLEYVRQVLRPDMDVQVVSVTEDWAQVSVAGPLSDAVLYAVMDRPDLPFMGCAPVEVGSVAGRLFRISFSGERAWEVAVPARYGAALYRLLVAQAETLGGCAYGMEALNVLRIEKGFLTHAEIHGRITAFDVGLDGMVAKGKDCIGWAMSRREGLLDEAREQLVGLRPLDPRGAVSAGAMLYAPEAKAERANIEGYVTSVCWSPTLGESLAMGFLTRGRARHSDVVRLVDGLRGIETLCRVADPVAYDPTGGRMRG